MSRELLVDRVYRHLLGQLAGRRFPLGTHLNAQKIAADLGISRTSVNGAIVRLSQDGWVQPNSGRRPVVAAYPEIKLEAEPDDFEFANQTERTYELILERIQRGEFYPGELLKERRIAQQLGVNAVTVHRAAEWLRNDGLLERLRRRGWKVVELRPEDLRDIYRIRALLEPRAVAAAIERISDGTLDELEAQTDRMIALGEHASVYDRRLADDAFHRTLAQHCGSRIVRDTLEPLIHRAILYTTVGFRYGRVVESFGEHKQVLQAIRNRDGKEAARRMKRHLRRAGAMNVRRAAREMRSDSPELTKIEQKH